MELINFNHRGLLPPWAFQQKLGTTITEKLRKLLFGSGQQGAFYVPQPIVDGQQVLYQDSAGTTPVTADGQPVGLMLDLHEGLKLGPELVTNGTFDTDVSGWTATSGDSIASVDGKLVVTADGSGAAYAQQTLTTSPGKTYQIKYTFFESSTNRYIRVGTLATGGQYLNIQNDSISFGENTAVFTATNSTSYLSVGCYTNQTAQFDNISVRELPGNHATQATAAAKPLYRTDGTLHWLEFDGVDDALRYDFATAVPYPLSIVQAVDNNSATGGSSVISIANPSASTIDSQAYFSLGQRGGDGTGPAIAVYSGGSYEDMTLNLAGDRFAFSTVFKTGAQRITDSNGATDSSLNKPEPTGATMLAINAFLRSKTSYYPGLFFGAVVVLDDIGADESSALDYFANKLG